MVLSMAQNDSSYKTVKDTRTVHIFVEDCKYYLIPDEGYPAECDHMKNESLICNPLKCPINRYRSYGYRIEEYDPIFDSSETKVKGEDE